MVERRNKGTMKAYRCFFVVEIKVKKKKRYYVTGLIFVQRLVNLSGYVENYVRKETKNMLLFQCFIMLRA